MCSRGLYLLCLDFSRRARKSPGPQRAGHWPEVTQQGGGQSWSLVALSQTLAPSPDFSEAPSLRSQQTYSRLGRDNGGCGVHLLRLSYFSGAQSMLEMREKTPTVGPGGSRTPALPLASRAPQGRPQPLWASVSPSLQVLRCCFRMPDISRKAECCTP